MASCGWIDTAHKLNDDFDVDFVPAFVRLTDAAPDILADGEKDLFMDLMNPIGNQEVGDEAAQPAKVAGTEKAKRPVSDDDDSSGHSRGEKKSRRDTTHANDQRPPPLLAVQAPPARTMDDFQNTIEEALQDNRIDEKKAARLQECLKSGDWSEIAFSCFCENIPMKRRGKGYSCRICSVPLKGHTCPYCPICSTPDTHFKKGDGHKCVNCPTCFEDGKRNKKLIQIKRAGHVCPHETAPPGKVPRKKARCKKGARKNCTEV